MKINFSTIWLTFYINIFYFLSVILFGHSIFLSDDDAYLSYLLGGGFGSPPTNDLHFNHIVHPFLSFFVKSLFNLNPNINWFTASLYFGNFIACNIILYRLLQVLGIKKAIGLYTALFIVFECHYLLQITFTNTALILGIAGVVLLISSAQKGKLNRIQIVKGCIVFLLASLFRIHVLLPLVGVSLPFTFLNKSVRQAGFIFLVFCLTTVLIILFNFSQQTYYKKNIAGWVAEETYRQAFFRYVNHPHVSNPSADHSGWNIEYDLVTNGLLIDTSFLSVPKLSEMSDQIRLSGNGSLITNKWFYIENRLYFFAIIVMGLFVKLNQKKTIAFWSSVLLSCLGIAFLSIFEKFPQYLLPSLLLLLTLMMMLNSEPRPASQIFKIFRLACLSLLIFWGLIRLYKINSGNRKKIEYFISAYHELKTHDNFLFVVTDDEFPLNYFNAWDAPKKFEIENMLYKENLLNNDYHKVIAHFNIENLQQLPEKSNVLFWGKRSRGLEQYYQNIIGRPVVVSDPLPEFKYEVRTIKYSDSVK